MNNGLIVLKKIIPLVFVIALLFCGCQAKNNTPKLTDFKQKASVSLGDFSYTCEICKTDEVIDITITSSNAKDMCISYNGDMVSFQYDDIFLEYEGTKIDKTNPAVAIFNAFEFIKNSENIDVSKTDNGFKYEGKTNLGSFILLLNDDLSYNSLEFKDANIKIEFLDK